ncbi:MAG: RNA polymerase sigma factor [Bryobacteraceae bacterium]
MTDVLEVVKPLAGLPAVRPETELLRAAQSADDSAQEELYERYFSSNRQVRNLLERQLKNPADREDVLHDAFLSLVRSNSEFRGDSSLRTFVYRVVQVTILQWRRKRRSAREDQMVRLTIDVGGEERERPIGVQDYCFQEVESSQTAQRLLELLNEPLRTTFRMRILHELSYEEIAQVTNTPINTVSTRIFKARAILAKLLGGR